MDLIERQSAIDAANRSDYDGLTVEDVAKVTDAVVEELKQLPSAQPERKKGKWIEHEWAEEVGGMLVSNYECSECHCWQRETSDFCPNCGADMRGEQDV